MGRNYYNDKKRVSAAVFLIGVLLAVASNGQTTVPRNTLRVSGTLCCTPNGNCPGQPVPDAAVTINCTDASGASTTLTDVHGNFSTVIPAISMGLIGSLGFLPCVAIVRLPLPPLACALLSNDTASGFLISNLVSQGSRRTALGLLQLATTGEYVNVSN